MPQLYDLHYSSGDNWDQFIEKLEQEFQSGELKLFQKWRLVQNLKDFIKFKGFKRIKEIKVTRTRMLVQPGQNGDQNEIVVIFMRRDLDTVATLFKDKYK